MDTNPKARLAIISDLTNRYLIALVLVAVLVTSSLFAVRYIISNQNDMAYLINISGKQRMLSQRVALLSQSMAVTRTPDEIPGLRLELVDIITEMQNNHRNIMLSELSKASEEIYFGSEDKLEAILNDFLNMASNLLHTGDSKLTLDNTDLDFIIRNSKGEMIHLLDKAVKQFEREAEESVGNINNAVLIVWGLILLLLVFEALFMFRPILAKTRILINELASKTYTRN